ncbi:MAG: coiled-coil domain-containing protein 22 [PVC group bacterium]|nr:coiled-coil domain-containing protein 22 [PVC group bacterium]
MADKEKVEIVINANTKNAEKNMGKLGKTANVLKKNWLAMGVAVTGATLAIKKGFDIAKEAAEYNQSVQAMERQFGVSSDAIISKLSEVSGGTVANKDLVLSANRAMALGVTKDVNKMAKMLEFARMRARAMGMDTNQAFNDLVVGIGRGSPLILDNLGLVVKGWAEEAKAAGVAYDSQFILNKVMAQAGDELKRVGKLVNTEAEDLQALNANWENLSIVIGNILLPIFRTLGAALSRTFKWLAENIPKAIDATVFAWDVLIQSFAVGIQWIETRMSQAAAWFAQPFLENINLVIAGINRLTGTEIEKLELISEATLEHNETALEQEKEKLEALYLTQEENELKTEERIKAHDKRKKKLADKSRAALVKAELKQFNDKRNKQIQELKNEIELTKRKKQIDTEMLKYRVQNMGLDTDAYQSWSSHMMGTLDKTSKKQFKIWKAFAIQSTIITTLQAAMNAYNAMAGIPYVGPALGAAAAAATGIMGALQVAKIASTDFQGAAEGALIRGTPGASGSLIRAGEHGRDEAIIPLENDEAMDKIGGIGDNVTVVFQVENMMADDELPEKLVDQIDKGLFELRQRGLSRA